MSLLGHKKILDNLKLAADKGDLRHSYMLFGAEGVGKKTLAMKLASYLEHGEENSERVLGDAKVISPEGSSFGIDEVRTIKGFLMQRPSVSRYRTIIVNDAELLTEEASNALLKITEEPPESGLLLLIVSDPEAISGTLASRLEKIYCPPVPTEEIEEWLVKEKELPKTKAKSAAEDSFGRPGLALRILQDEKFKEMQNKVKAFVSVRPAALKAHLKELLDDEEFRLRDFLDAFILYLSWDKKKNLELWHKVLELRHTAQLFGLNPRIQLTNLHRLIK